MSEPVDPRPGQPAPGSAGAAPAGAAEGPAAPSTEHPTEQLGWPPAGATVWTPPPVDGSAGPEPQTVFLGNAYDPPAAPAPTVRRSGAVSTVGLVLAGLVIGGVAVWAVQSQSSGAATQNGATTSQNQLGGGLGQNGSGQNGTAPNGQGQNGTGQNGTGQNGFGPGGGLAGEERLAGRITAIGSSTVTVSAGGSTETFTVVSDTEIVRNGAQASLSDLKVGDAAFLHVYPQGSKMLVERIFAGTLPGGGQGVPGFGRPGGQGDDQTGQNGTTTTT